MDYPKNYTDEELTAAKSTDLRDLVQSFGFSLKRVGRFYQIDKKPWLMLFPSTNSWKNYHNDGYYRNGGSTIDFMLEFGDANNVVEAVHMINDVQNNYVPREYDVQLYDNTQTKDFELPEKAESYRNLYAYLIKTRGLSSDVVSYFVKDLKILYQDKEHNNIVFLGKDKNGEVKYATKRGTYDRNGYKYRGDVTGSDKLHYGVNIVNKDSDIVKVFEATIDLMSYMDLTGDYTTNKLVLGSISDGPLKQFLSDNPHVKKIAFCIDNDEPAHKALYGVAPEIDQETGEILKEETVGLIEKYRRNGYKVADVSAPKMYNSKDYNEVLINLKKYAPQKVYVLQSNRKSKAI